jgi:hypothetical protein
VAEYVSSSSRLVELELTSFAPADMSGINAINYYSPTLFASVGVTDTSLYTGIYGVLKAAASIIFFTFLVRFLPILSFPHRTDFLSHRSTHGVVVDLSCSVPSRPASACST